MKNNDDMKFASETADEAVEWFIKLLDKDLSEANYQEWKEWLAKNDANKEAFARAEDCWRGLYNVTSQPLIQKNTITSSKRITSLSGRFTPFGATIVIILSLGAVSLAVRMLL